MVPERIAVITPVGPNRRHLAAAVECVAAQTRAAYCHILVYDGAEADDVYPSTQRVVLPVRCRDSGATPRAVGVNLALAQLCDGIALLDADNVWLPEHLADLAKAAANADVAVSDRVICDEALAPLPASVDESDGVAFADTNVMLLTGRALDVAPLLGAVRRREGVDVGAVDRFFWERVRSYRVSVARTHQATVLYRSCWVGHYQAAPERRPSRMKTIEMIDGVPVVRWIER